MAWKNLIKVSPRDVPDGLLAVLVSLDEQSFAAAMLTHTSDGFYDISKPCVWSKGEILIPAEFDEHKDGYCDGFGSNFAHIHRNLYKLQKLEKPFGAKTKKWLRGKKFEKQVEELIGSAKKYAVSRVVRALLATYGTYVVTTEDGRRLVQRMLSVVHEAEEILSGDIAHWVSVEDSLSSFYLVQERIIERFNQLEQEAIAFTFTSDSEVYAEVLSLVEAMEARLDELSSEAAKTILAHTRKLAMAHREENNHLLALLSATPLLTYSKEIS